MGKMAERWEVSVSQHPSPVSHLLPKSGDPICAGSSLDTRVGPARKLLARLVGSLAGRHVEAVHQTLRQPRANWVGDVHEQEPGHARPELLVGGAAKDDDPRGELVSGELVDHAA